MSANAQARGLVVLRIAGKACSNTLTGHTVKRRCVRASQDGTQCPQRATVAIVRTAIFQPMALVIHEVAKASGFGIEGIPDKSEITGGQFARFSIAQFFQKRAHHQRAGIVVGGVTFEIVGNRENGVLQYAGLVRHVTQVIEFERRQFARVFV